MPTTRFASAAVNTDSPILNGRTHVATESLEEQRHKSFNNRKKREAPTDLSSTQKVMIHFIDHITE
jgi:hypothetical protein